MTPGEEPRSSIAQLKEKVSHGATPHEVIGKVLREDARRLYTYHRCHLLAEVGGAKPKPIDPEVVDLYELQPKGGGVLPNFNPANNSAFVGGFGYVASYMYPLLEAASRPADHSKHTVSPTVEAMLNNLRAKDKTALIVRLHLDESMVEVVVDDVRKKMIYDASGTTWLKEKVQEEFREGNLELAGALRAIQGAKKLFDVITADTL